MPRNKRDHAGSHFRPPGPPVSGSPRTCPDCNGHRYETRPQAEGDEDGQFDGASNIKCRTCDGEGVVQ